MNASSSSCSLESAFSDSWPLRKRLAEGSEVGAIKGEVGAGDGQELSCHGYRSLDRWVHLRSMKAGPTTLSLRTFQPGPSLAPYRPSSRVTGFACPRAEWQLSDGYGEVGQARATGIRRRGEVAETRGDACFRKEDAPISVVEVESGLEGGQCIVGRWKLCCTKSTDGRGSAGVVVGIAMTVARNFYRCRTARLTLYPRPATFDAGELKSRLTSQTTWKLYPRLRLHQGSAKNTPSSLPPCGTQLETKVAACTGGANDEVERTSYRCMKPTISHSQDSLLVALLQCLSRSDGPTIAMIKQHQSRKCR